MEKYEVRFRDNGVNADAWDKAPDYWQWAVFGPSPPFVFGEVVALFVKKEHAEKFAEELNTRATPPTGGCPFCKAPGEVTWEREWVYVRCGSCHARGPAIGKGSSRVSREYLIKEAVAGWNLGARR